MQQRLNQPRSALSVRYGCRLHCGIAPLLLGRSHDTPIQEAAEVIANNALDEFTLTEFLANASLHVPDRSSALESKQTANGLSNCTNEWICRNRHSPMKKQMR